MARLDSSDPIAPVKKPRGFPFRLVLYALIMTGAAGLAGWYAWTQREKNQDKDKVIAACEPAKKQAMAELDVAKKDLTTATTAVAELSEQKKQTDAQLARVGKDLNASQEELTALRNQRAEIEKRMKAISDIQAQFAKMIDTGQLQVSARRGSLVVELPAEVLFGSASSELSEDGNIKIIQVGGILKQFGDRRFLVVGHTDNVPLKGTTDNWALSTQRALTVTRVLVKAGMKPEQLVAAGAGENDPIAKNDNGQNRQRNRRIEIQLLPAVSELPPLPASLDPNAAPTGAPTAKKEN
jgi:chemotaxis protein MotB